MFVKYKLPKILFAALIFFIFGCNVRGQNTISTKQKKSVTLCEIRSDPREYLNQEIQVGGVYVREFEMSWLDDTQPCILQGDRLHGIKYKFDDRFDEVTEKKMLRRFYKQLKKETGGAGPPKVSGVYVVKIEPFEKLNEFNTRAEFQIRIMKLVSIRSQ